MPVPQSTGSVVKIRDVANAAGVSPATVSRVLNGTAAVSPERAAAVRAAAQELGYTPSGPARALRQQRARVWAAIIADIENPFFTSMVRGIEDGAREAGHRLVLCNSDEDGAKEAEYIDIVLAEQMSGVVIAVASDSSRLDTLLERGVPVVAVDRIPRRHADRIDSVVVDNIAGARNATQHLAEAGAKRIACITGPEHASTATERLTGYAEGLRRAGQRFDAGLIRRADFKEGGGYEAARSLLARRRRPDALFVANNLMTLGAMRAAREAGLDVPDDLFLVGFDDAPWSALMQPSLTAVAQPSYEVGRKAAELLASASAEGTSRRVVLAPELVERDSSRRTG